MAKRNQHTEPSKPAANIAPERASKLLKGQLDEIDSLQKLSRKAPEADAWKQKTVSILTLVFGDPSIELTRFKRIWFTPGMYYQGQPESDFQAAHLRGLANAKNILAAILFEYDQAHNFSNVESETPMPKGAYDAAKIVAQQTSNFALAQNSQDYFVAHEFSASGLEDLRSAIQEALSSSGLEPYFADKEVIEGQIFINKILPKIRGCRFGIYDISNPAKPNVFIELGAAIAMGARYYIVVREGIAVPSDLQGLDRIEYRSFEHLKAQLRAMIKQ